MVFVKLGVKHPLSLICNCFHQERKIYEGGEGAFITMWIIHLIICSEILRRSNLLSVLPQPVRRSSRHFDKTDICSSDCEAANRAEVLERQGTQWLQAYSLIHFNQVQCRCDLRIMSAVYNSSLRALRGLFDERVYQGEGLCTAVVIWTVKWVCQVFLLGFVDCGREKAAKSWMSKTIL